MNGERHGIAQAVNRCYIMPFFGREPHGRNQRSASFNLEKKPFFVLEEGRELIAT